MIKKVLYRIYLVKIINLTAARSFFFFPFFNLLKILYRVGISPFNFQLIEFLDLFKIGEKEQRVRAKAPLFFFLFQVPNAVP